VNLQTAAQHTEVMRKVESLNLLQGSNQQLVEENMRIASQLQDLTVKVSISMLINCYFALSAVLELGLVFLE